MFDQLTMPIDIIAKKRGLWPAELWNGETVSSCPVEGAPPTMRRLMNFCFELPLVVGDIVEIRAQLGRNPQVRNVRQLLPGLLLIVDGCSRLSRAATCSGSRLVPVDGTPDGMPGTHHVFAGDCRDGDGITEEWYRQVVARFSGTGCDCLETDGDRLVAFWGLRPGTGAAGGAVTVGASVVAACADSGIPTENMQILDHGDRVAVLEKFMRMQLSPAAA